MSPACQFGTEDEKKAPFYGDGGPLPLHCHVIAIAAGGKTARGKMPERSA